MIAAAPKSKRALPSPLNPAPIKEPPFFNIDENNLKNPLNPDFIILSGALIAPLIKVLSPLPANLNACNIALREANTM